MLKAGMTVYVVVTNHPKCPHMIRENENSRPAYTDEGEANRLCDFWNDFYTQTNTPQPWPYFVLECVVQPTVKDGQLSLALIDC